MAPTSGRKDSLVLSFKNLSVSVRPNNSAPRHTPKGTEDTDSPKGLYMNIRSSTVPNSQKVQTAQISMYWLMNYRKQQMLPVCAKRSMEQLNCLPFPLQNLPIKESCKDMRTCMTKNHIR